MLCNLPWVEISTSWPGKHPSRTVAGTNCKDNTSRRFTRSSFRSALCVRCELPTASGCAEHTLPLCPPYTPTSKPESSAIKIRNKRFIWQHVPCKVFKSRILYSLSWVETVVIIFFIYVCTIIQCINTHVVCAVSNVTCALSLINQARPTLCLNG